MKVLHISDSHSFHNLINVPYDVDCIIHSGDSTNYNDTRNIAEMLDFLEWFGNIKFPWKIYVPGNHDWSLAHDESMAQRFSDLGIYLLINQEVILGGTKFYGTPYTPIFGQWSFMRARHKMEFIWNQVPDDTNVLITHGPPKGILDITEDYDRRLLHVGCGAMMHKIESLGLLTHCLFGHVHDNHDELNGGILIRDGITYSNGSLVKDGQFGHLVHQGNILEI